MSDDYKIYVDAVRACDTERWSWRFDRLRRLARSCLGVATVVA
jgi:hypothetical protein